MPKPTRKPSLFDWITRSVTTTISDADQLAQDCISQNGEPYITRHFLLGNLYGPNARYHHILTSDPQPLHDHPWDFISVILQGSYVETTPQGEQEHRQGSVLLRKAEDLHRLTITAPVWTFVIVSAARRQWGFQTEDGWTHWRQFLTDQSD